MVVAQKTMFRGGLSSTLGQVINLILTMALYFSWQTTVHPLQLDGIIYRQSCFDFCLSGILSGHTKPCISIKNHVTVTHGKHQSSGNELAFIWPFFVFLLSSHFFHRNLTNTIFLVKIHIDLYFQGIAFMVPTWTRIPQDLSFNDSSRNRDPAGSKFW